MQLRMIAFSLGIAAVTRLPVLPDLLWVACAVAVAMVLLCWRRRACGLLAAFLLASSWALVFGHSLLNSVLPPALEGKVLTLEGQIIGLPEQRSYPYGVAQQFDLRLSKKLCYQQQCAGVKTLRLKWFEAPALQPGQQWRLQVKLKRPHGIANPGGFDYASWLVAQGIGAVGYVKQGSVNQLLSVDTRTVDYKRWQIASLIDRELAALEYRHIFTALLIADRRRISHAQQALFAETGTSHLMVISGLHIGLVAGIGFWLGRLMALIGGLPAQRIAPITAITVAVLYSAAAGFSLPTQRALITIVVWMLALLLNRQVSALTVLLTALSLCLLIDPLAPIGLSFWLSFAAVFSIVYGVSGRKSREPKWWRYVTVQWLIFIAMLPVLAALLGQAPVISPLCNVIAVPVFSLVLVPGNLLAAVIAYIDVDTARWLWGLLHSLLSLLMQYLQQASALAEGVQLQFSAPQWSHVALAVAGAALLLAPRGVPMRYCGAVLVLPLLLASPAKLAEGELALTVVDVGQGLAIVIQTAEHTLVYDVGSANGDQFSMARAALIPWLRHHGVSTVDKLILSHGDNDHAGGWQELMATVPATTIDLGEGVPGISKTTATSRFCQSGTAWQWDDVHFAYLAPFDQPQEHASAVMHHSQHGGNNRSCVLQISVADTVFLLPGDIERRVEQMLVQNYGDALQSTVLIAPHHGSKTSSSWPFIRFVNPQHVVFSSGYRNRFQHPASVVQARYRALNSRLYSTVETGAIRFFVSKTGELSIESFRQHYQRYWL